MGVASSSTNPSQETKDALYKACRNSDLETCEALINKNQSLVDIKLNSIGATPLMLASENIAEFLINKNAKLDLQDAAGKTALMHACSNPSNNIAEILIKNNANVALQDLQGNSALHQALIYGHSEQTVGSLIEKLAEVANVDLQNSQGETALHWASSSNNPGIVQKLIKAGARLDLTTKTGESPLHTASKGGNIKTVDILVQAGAIVDLANPYTKETPLHLVCTRNVNFELQGYKETSQFEDVATKTRKNLLETAKFLIARTANIDAVDSKRETALFKAIRNGHTDIARQLIKKGAKIDQVAEDGRTSIDIACQNYNTRIVRILFNAGANVDPKMIEQVKSDQQKTDSNADKRIEMIELINKITNKEEIAQRDADLIAFNQSRSSRGANSAGATLEGRAKEGVSSEISPEMKSLIPQHASETRSGQAISFEPGSAPLRPSAIDVESTVKLPNSAARTPS